MNWSPEVKTYVRTVQRIGELTIQLERGVLSPEDRDWMSDERARLMDEAVQTADRWVAEASAILDSWEAKAP